MLGNRSGSLCLFGMEYYLLSTPVGREPASSTDLANNRGMQKGGHQFVMTSNRNSRASGPLKYIKPASVLLLKVKVSHCQTLKRKAQVTGHRYGLAKSLGRMVKPSDASSIHDGGNDGS
jgi:hypothetical protein